MELEEILSRYSDGVNDCGRSAVVRIGRHRKCNILTGVSDRCRQEPQKVRSCIGGAALYFAALVWRYLRRATVLDATQLYLFLQ